MHVVDTIINYNTRPRPQESLVLGGGDKHSYPHPTTYYCWGFWFTHSCECNQSGFAKLLFEDITFGQ